MTLRQLAQIKKEYPFLKMEKELTSMFDNEHWAAVFSYQFIHGDQMLALCKHLEKEDLIYFFGGVGLHIQ